MLNKIELRDVIIAALQQGSFPENAALISQAIASYVRAKGTALPPTISYVLAPCDGMGLKSLIPLAIASKKGVASSIISPGIAAEFGGSTKVVPASHGTHVRPMSFNTTVKVPDLSDLTDFEVVWEKISDAIIKFFEPEIK